MKREREESERERLQPRIERLKKQMAAELSGLRRASAVDWYGHPVGARLRRRAHPRRLGAIPALHPAIHQTCLGHLLRRGRTLCRDQPRSRIAADIQALLKQALRLRDDDRASELSRDDLSEALEALAARLARQLLRPGHWPIHSASRSI